jgi:hypothetical protein
MKQHALQTAMTLYAGGSLDLQTAATRAGISPDRLQLAVERIGGSTPSPTVEREGVTVRAD